MEKIDVLILANNEEGVIKDAIESVKGWAENIVVIDAKSTDKTVEIAKKYGAQVFEHDFKDFSDQRNFAFTKAESPWVFYLDADERATEEFLDELRIKIESLSDDEVGGFIVKRKTFYFGHDWGFVDEVARIFRVSKFGKWTGVVHETPVVSGQLIKIDSPILHFTHRNLEQMVEKTNEWSNFEAELRLKAHHPKMRSWRFFRVMLSAFIKSYVKDKGYKNGTYGLIESIYQSFSMFITYAKLWELQMKK